MTGGVVELTIPARDDMLLIARMTLSGVCARCGFGLDMLEDARIAADEACYCLTHQRAAADALRMTCSWDRGRLAIAFESIRAENADDPVQTASLGEDAQSEALAKGILETLAASARLHSDERGVYAIHMEMDYNAGDAGEAYRGG
ncbi:MAG: hypothetical protein LBH66_02135 [Oscillospiraceae bacterium]|jgi:anti-sigma regulatory factor (Ser/Thr protein kinase)|nr:hypothetical protein [Oscillospiraceae bacterium]